MQVQQLNLQSKIHAGQHFRDAYGAAHHAADVLARQADDDGRVKPDMDLETSKRLVSSLTTALCAARALESLLAGNQPPRRGE